MHTPEEIGIDAVPGRSVARPAIPDRTAQGLWTHQKGGFYHDGRFATLLDVVEPLRLVLALGLSDAKSSELVEYLKSL